MGCGWLGLPLALHLKDRGYTVKGSRTTQTGADLLLARGIQGFALEWTTGSILVEDAFWASEVLIVNIPPPMDVTPLLKKVQSSHVLFVSSTSVYADNNGVVTEEDETIPGKELVAAERQLMQSTDFTVTIVRPGGLIGYDRLPTSAGRTLRSRSWDAPMNVIHRDDLVAILTGIIETSAWGEVFNTCMTGHPGRRSYYRAAAAYGGWNLGKLGVPVNIFAVIYTAYVMVFLAFPSFLPVAGDNFNYALPIFAFVFLVALDLWFGWARKNWPGLNKEE